MTLVFACAPPAVNAHVESAAKARGIWVCRADRSDGLRLPGVVREGALRIAVSTGGRAPAAARAVRAVLAERMPAWGELTRIVADYRQRWRASPGRAERLRALIRGPLAPMLHFGRAPEPGAIEDWLQSLQASD
jgi:precorrin-2 dehydrogenase/sirohydrochlorin ferrochelatase